MDRESGLIVERASPSISSSRCRGAIVLRQIRGQLAENSENCLQAVLTCPLRLPVGTRLSLLNTFA